MSKVLLARLKPVQFRLVTRQFETYKCLQQGGLQHFANLSDSQTMLFQQVRAREKVTERIKIYSARSTLDNTWGLAVKTKWNKSCHHKLSIISLHLSIRAFIIITQNQQGEGRKNSSLPFASNYRDKQAKKLNVVTWSVCQSPPGVYQGSGQCCTYMHKVTTCQNI